MRRLGRFTLAVLAEAAKRFRPFSPWSWRAMPTEGGRSYRRT